MSKIIKSINDLMSKQPIGSVVSRSAIAKELGVSERTVTRAMDSLSCSELGEWVMVYSPSLVRVSGAVCPNLDKTEPEHESTCPDLDKPVAEPEETCPTLDKPFEPEPEPAELSAPEPAAFVLPSGFTIQPHKYAGQVVVDAKGLVDALLTEQLAKSKQSSDPWMAESLAPGAGDF
jgi:hypothetical protein